MTATTHSALLRTNPILAKFHTALHEIYGSRLEHVVLFGSRARGDAGADSKYWERSPLMHEIRNEGINL